MHQAQSYIDTHLKTVALGGKLSTVVLNAVQAAALRQALSRDAADYVYSGIVSIGDAVQGIERNLFTWATVKLYYAVFYMTRAVLAAHGTAIFYDGTKPYSWESTAGVMAVKRDGPTHKAVLTSFGAVLPSNPLLSQPIGVEGALDWLMKRREEVNYTSPRFSEPNAPAHLDLIARTGVRKSVSAYLKDNSFLYAFDPQHAILAFPIEALKLVLKSKTTGGAGIILANSDRKYLASLYVDKTGPLAEAVNLIRV
ncbi:hypothetical protein [Burkholderia gladioli]|uniref:hypothetical protein n=1 Tax=Burkholderia gladioli TaxID=28095 RepID=UPI001641E8EE|nr:hypothetical protein [Burkholderia gladioli]